MATVSGKVSMSNRDYRQRWTNLPKKLKSRNHRIQALYSRTKVDHVVSRGYAANTTIAGIDAVVCGHTAIQTPVIQGNMAWIETGVFCTGKLTVIGASEL
ncbi:hypothetical protein GCM10022278_38050 [Allohahella marinimesophila]|uniref:Uncharacterized protein n=1 Tax=Allohahella marinimesophila TaxID=1054972 RepID=A0ABP7Q7T0_9GAMM